MEVQISPQEALVVLLYVAPIQLAGAAAGPIVYLINTTRQKILGQQLAQSQKMQVVGQLARGIAHDLNNSLTSMIVFYALLLQRHGAGDQLFDDIMQIEQNANQGGASGAAITGVFEKTNAGPATARRYRCLGRIHELAARFLGEQVEMRPMGFLRAVFKRSGRNVR